MSFCFPRLHLFFLPPLSLTSLEERKTFKMASSQSLAALRAYVCAPGQAGGANQAESTVRLNVEHVALKATRFAELRLDKHVRVKTSSRWADRWFLPFFSPSSRVFALLCDPAVDASFSFPSPRGTRKACSRLLFNFRPETRRGSSARERNHSRRFIHSTTKNVFDEEEGQQSHLDLSLSLKKKKKKKKKQMTIAVLKHKLASHTGTAAEDIVRLVLLDSTGAVVARLDAQGEETKLGFFSPEDGFCLRFDDANPCSLAKSGWLEDTGLVEKYEMKDEDYDRREGTFREFARRRREQDPGWTLEKEMSARRNGGVAVNASCASAGPSSSSAAAPENSIIDGDHQRDLASAIKPGDRCEVNPGGKRALVRFVGNSVETLPRGFWVGVEYDEPVGKNDGRPPKSDTRLFECAANHGGFVRPASVTVGDFPPADGALFDSEDEM